MVADEKFQKPVPKNMKNFQIRFSSIDINLKIYVFFTILRIFILTGTDLFYM